LRQSALVLATLDSYGVQSARVVPFEIDPADSRLLPPDPQVAARIRPDLCSSLAASMTFPASFKRIGALNP
jgi:hypothetical protein